MRKTAVFLAFVAAVAAWPAAQAAVTTYKATLSGASEVPPVTTQAKGTAAVSVDPTTKQISWRIEYSGLKPTAAHIHCGAAAGANAGVAVNFGANLASPIEGSGALTDAQLADLAAGKCYINIHTAANKGGELRGQLVP